MHEQVLSVDIENMHLLDYVDHGIADTISPIGGIVARTNSDSRAYLAVAVNEVFTKQTNDIILTLLLDVLTIGYKHQYLINKLHSNDRGFVHNTLVNSMSIFDSGADKQYLKTQLTDGSTINLDGYYNFRMRYLKSKWDEIINLANDNGSILYDVDVMSEFLSYMIEGMPRVINNLSVVMDSKSYYLFDSKNNIIANTILPIDNMSVEECVILDIIINKPNSLTIYCDNFDCSKEFVNTVDCLFDVNFIKNS